MLAILLFSLIISLERFDTENHRLNYNWIEFNRLSSNIEILAMSVDKFDISGIQKNDCKEWIEFDKHFF